MKPNQEEGNYCGGIRHILLGIMKAELKDEWKLDIHFDWKVGWEGEAFGDGRCIMLFLSDGVDPFGPFLHELAHAIDIEDRGEPFKLDGGCSLKKSFDVHDARYADILTRLMIKYMKPKVEYE
jgi:hypothetical protein